MEQLRRSELREEEEEDVGLQRRRPNNVHGENDFISSEEDQGSHTFLDIKSDSVPHFTTPSQKVLGKESYEVSDLDVKGVLEKQETYDLICPHCHKDITKKVILHKRGKPPNPEKDVFLCSECFRFFTRLGHDCFAKLGCFSPVRSEVGEWGILKSVVYGGLAESITSLGIVSSAAGAAAATVNIMGLAMANLIGGLFIIVPKLLELRKSSNGASSSDRYLETLGPRDKYILHVVTVLLSFLIFGAVPPIVYGFSFRESDDKELKLAVTAASSLVCIALLAAGKARVRSPPRSCVKTVLYYVVVGFVASGVSYVVGGLFDRLLTYLGLFVSSSGTNVSVREAKLGWAYY